MYIFEIGIFAMKVIQRGEDLFNYHLFTVFAIHLLT